MFDPSSPLYSRTVSRRSPVLSLHGAVASSQPLASEVGLRVLRSGGNCVDACVAMAAALNVTEPCSTGIGGDCFAIFFDAKTGQVQGLNASGRSPQALTREKVVADLKAAEVADVDELQALPARHVHTITVPGAAAGWADAVEKWGTMSLKDVLQPAIELAEEGVPVHPTVAKGWAKYEQALRETSQALGQDRCAFLVGEGDEARAPKVGEVFKNPELAATFRRLAERGKAGFYEGETAQAIVDAVQKLGGCMTLEDLAAHRSDYPEPIRVKYRGVDVWEIPPNGQGITALLALNVLEGLDVAGNEPGSAQHLHTLIEAMRVAFADTRWYVADPEHSDVPVEALLSEEYAAERRKLIDPERATVDVKRGSPVLSCGTVYFTVVDEAGNACSFINSNYMGFGHCAVPSGCGFTLQNRGANFSLEDGHPNVVAGGKRPYHTIIPGMATKNGELYAPFGVMGGFMQPQGHVQVMVNMLDFGMDPQAALDQPRFCIRDGTSGGAVCIEEGVEESVIEELRQRGHVVEHVTGHARSVFGRGQIIRKVGRVLWSGSDGRADGMAIGY